MKFERSVGIDCLRAAAVVWVMLYHYVPGISLFNRGTFGVLLFFIISGYCIAFSVETSHTAWHFYAKRLGRLLPALVVCGFLTVAFKKLAPGLVDPGRVADWLSYFYMPFGLSTLNILQKHFMLPDAAYWSLKVEFQFYAFCFLMMALGLRDRLIPLLCVVVIFRTLTTDVTLHETPGYNSTNDFFPFFIAGMSVAALMRQRFKEAVLGIIFAFSMELYHLRIGVQQPSAPLELYRSLMLWAGTAAVYVAARYDHLLPRASRVVAFVGVVSYPLYLIHQDVGLMTLKAMHVGLATPADFAIRGLALPLVMIAVATCVYLIVERPLNRPLTLFLANPTDWRFVFRRKVA